MFNPYFWLIVLVASQLAQNEPKIQGLNFYKLATSQLPESLVSLVLSCLFPYFLQHISYSYFKFLIILYSILTNTCERRFLCLLMGDIFFHLRGPHKVTHCMAMTMYSISATTQVAHFSILVQDRFGLLVMLQPEALYSICITGGLVFRIVALCMVNYLNAHGYAKTWLIVKPAFCLMLIIMAI